MREAEATERLKQWNLDHERLDALPTCRETVLRPAEGRRPCCEPQGDWTSRVELHSGTRPEMQHPNVVGFGFVRSKLKRRSKGVCRVVGNRLREGAWHGLGQQPEQKGSHDAGRKPGMDSIFRRKGLHATDATQPQACSITKASTRPCRTRAPSLAIPLGSAGR
jgi:hypothetical protein